MPVLHGPVVCFVCCYFHDGIIVRVSRTQAVNGWVAMLQEVTDHLLLRVSDDPKHTAFPG